ncbi:MAG TPA: trehalose-phosphatase [Gemmatimonadota bacterium]|nr:trehalose-phosphatase [Gemmatimonadota bacterium]
MEILSEAFDADAFFKRVRREAVRVLFLDFDGTLAPFRADPSVVRPYEGVPGRLERIRGAGTRLVLVSGRPAAEVRERLGLEPAPEVWGTHGWERAPAGARPGPVDLPEPARRGLAAAAGRIGSSGAGRLERKPAALALHVRGEEEGRASRALAAAREAWEPVAGRFGLELRPFDGGLELRVPGRDKGHAVRTVLAEAEPGAVAYLGDDDTDEDAFRALAGRGASVLVRPELRPTAADAWIRPPDELLDFLDRWAEAAGAEARAEPREGDEG